ncbi:MAG: hypothetical protein R2788_21980 [Saprospiraceae bacterium]
MAHGLCLFFNSDTTFGRTVIDFNEEPPLVYREDRNHFRCDRCQLL